MDETIYVIERGTRAFTELQEIFADPNTNKVSLEFREDGMAIKANEYMWTYTLPHTLAGAQ